MLTGVRNFFRAHGLIILILILGLLGSLLLVWWRLGFSLEFFQPFAAQQCTTDADCGQYGCGSGGLCNKCGGATGAQADASCPSPAEACEQVFCVSEGKGFNHCVIDDAACPKGGGGPATGGGATYTQFSLRNNNLSGGCKTPGELGGSGHATVRVTDSGTINTHIVWNVFHSDTAGCAATSAQPSGGGSKSGKCDFTAPHQGGDCALSYSVGQHNCGRVQVDAAFSDGALGPNVSPVFIGQVIDYGIDCGSVQPETHAVCQNNMCVQVQGAGTDECSSDAQCGGTQTHMACQDNACVVMQGSGTNECTTDAQCTSTTDLVCDPKSLNRAIDEDAAFTATGGTGTYTWTAPSGSPASGNGTPFTTRYAAEGSYMVTVTSGNDTDTCEVTVTEEPQDLICTPAQNSAEIGELVDLVAQGGSGTYTWSAPDGDPTADTGSNFSVSYDAAGDYEVLVRDDETQETAICEVTVQAEETPPGEPGLQLQKYVVTRGGAEVKSRTADPNETVEFVLYVTSNGTEDLLNVEVRDQIPNGLDYVDGSATLDGNTLSDSEMTGVIELGDMSPGEEHEIRFEVDLEDEDYFDFGSTTMVNVAYADADNAPEVSDRAFVIVERDPENPTLRIRKFGRNVTRNEIGERTSVNASPNDTIEFTIRVENNSDATAENVTIQDVVPGGVTYQSGTATLNGQPTSDILVSSGVNIGDLEPDEEAIVRFLGRVAPANQLPVGTTVLINVARTWADGIPRIQAQLPIIISTHPTIPPPEIETGPGETTVLALIVSTIVTLMYIGYTSTDTFRRREAEDIAGGGRGGNFK